MSGGLPYDLARLTRWSIPLTWGVAGLGVAVTVETLFAERIYGDFYGDLAFDATIDATVSSLLWIRIAIGIGTSVIVLAAYVMNGIWIYRASWNARLIQPYAARISPGWAVGWYFIPVANLWKPLEAMRQTWAAVLPPSPLVGWWWALWLAGGVISFGGGLLQGSLWVLESGLITLLSVVASVLSVLCTILFLRIVRRITAAQSAHGPASVFA